MTRCSGLRWVNVPVPSCTPQTAAELGARAVPERRRGYAGALETGFAEAQGDYVLTLDADLSHEPAFAAKLWRARTEADIVIASRKSISQSAREVFCDPCRRFR